MSCNQVMLWLGRAGLSATFFGVVMALSAFLFNYLYALLKRSDPITPEDPDLQVFDCPHCGSTLTTVTPLYHVPECGICGSPVKGRAPGLSEHAAPFGQTEARAKQTLEPPS